MLNQVRRLWRFVAALVITLGISLISYQIALAYGLLGGKWSGFPIYYIRSVDGSPGSYISIMDSAVSSWNATPTKARIYLTSPDYEKVDIHAGYYGAPTWCAGYYESWYGCTEHYPSRTANPYTYVNIKINRDLIDPENWPGLRTQGTVVHEIGHALGLAHVGGCVIMNGNSYYRYYTCGIYTPQSDDINGINALYP